MHKLFRAALLLAFSTALLAQSVPYGSQIQGVSGNGRSLVTTTGSQTSGNCVTIDANGNHVASGSGCGGSGGTVSSVAITSPSSLFSESGCTITTSGTCALSFATGQTANRIFGSDASGNVGSFALTRAMLPTLLAADIPASLTSTTSVNGTSIPSSVTLTQTIASGTSALGTSAISSGACASVVTTSATGTATTDVISATFNADPTAVTGYSPTTNGMLAIIGYPTANNVNWKVCNNTSASITPGAITLNWRVAR